MEDVVMRQELLRAQEAIARLEGELAGIWFMAEDASPTDIRAQVESALPHLNFPEG